MLAPAPTRRLGGPTVRDPAQAPALAHLELLRALPAAALVWRRGGALIEVSSVAAQLLGDTREALIARGLHACWPDASAAEATAATEGADRREASLRRADGDRVPTWVTTHQTGDGTYVSVLVDLRERRRLEDELLQARKLESIGQLASGIAHELNTPIQFVGDNLFFLQDAFTDLMTCVARYREALAAAARGELDDAHVAAVRAAEEVADIEFLTEELPESLTRAREGTERVSTIVRAMRTFARARPRRGPCDLNAELDAVLVIARNEYKYVADVETRFGDIPTLMGDAGRLVQLALNLIVNATHAIADAPGERGLITVSTALEGDEVVLRVSDDGVGIPPEHLERIFEPFFTTKVVGRGLGQGLPLVRAVAREHGGRVVVSSAVGRGTTVAVHLPITGAPDGERF